MDMKKSSLIIITAVIVLLMVFSFLPENVMAIKVGNVVDLSELEDAPVLEGEQTIVLLHINDTHGKIDSFAKITQFVKETEDEYGEDNVFLMSAGDMFSGNPLVDQYDFISGEADKKGYPMIDLMNAAGFDLMVIGNHEFDYGQDTLNKRIEQADFPMICANFEASGAILEQPAAYEILETDRGVRIAVLGLIQIDEGTGIPATHPDKLNGINFFNGVTEAHRCRGLAKASHVFVVLSHLGNSTDKDLANEMGGIDIILGGHSHTTITDPAETNGVLIAQAGDDGAYVGKVVITLKDGVISDKRGGLIDVSDVKGSDENVEAMIKQYNEERDTAFSKVLATAVSPVNGKHELGSLMTDAITIYHDLDFSFQNNGGIRVDILGNNEDGGITVGDIYTLDPFGNEVIKLEMTVDEIKSLIEYSYGKRSSIDLQVSGLKYNVLVNDIGQIAGVELTDYQGNTLDEDKKYSVGLNSYIASSYEFDHKDEGTSLYISYADTLIEYLKTIDTIDYDGVEARTGIKRVAGGEGTTVAYTEVDLTTDNKMTASNTAGNLMADAIKSVTGVDIGTYCNSDLASGSINAGPIYKEVLGSVYGSFNYSNNVDLITVTGSDIEKILLAQCQYNNGAAVQVSGMTYQIVQNSSGDIVDINAFIDGLEINPDKEYTIAINGYRSQYYKGSANNVINSTTTETTEEEILLEYLQNLESQGLKVTDSVRADRIEIKVQ
ncbi:MAG: 5'-nucleotidase C-terminal domain-containing protein [Halanaerobiales bacterium]